MSADETKKLQVDEKVISDLIEALKTSHENMAKLVDHGVLMEKVGNIEKSLNEIKTNTKEAHQKFVTKEEFKPVKMIVFGVVALINVTVFGALLTLVVKSV